MEEVRWVTGVYRNFSFCELEGESIENFGSILKPHVDLIKMGNPRAKNFRFSIDYGYDNNEIYLTYDRPENDKEYHARKHAEAQELERQKIKSEKEYKKYLKLKEKFEK